MVPSYGDDLEVDTRSLALVRLLRVKTVCTTRIDPGIAALRFNSIGGDTAAGSDFRRPSSSSVMNGDCLFCPPGNFASLHTREVDFSMETPSSRQVVR